MHDAPLQWASRSELTEIIHNGCMIAQMTRRNDMNAPGCDPENRDGHWGNAANAFEPDIKRLPMPQSLPDIKHMYQSPEILFASPQRP